MMRGANRSVSGNSSFAWGKCERYGCIWWQPGQKYLLASTFSACKTATNSSRDSPVPASSTSTTT